MYKVLLVEDEMLVRFGLKNSIDWNTFNMTVIADAANGQDAWQLYISECPDIIITDIKMPIMGGMELIEKIRREDAQVKIIILSCLEDFNLAKKAMAFGVSDYILKMTMTEEETEAVLKKVQLELDSTHKVESERKLTNKNTDILKEKLLTDYLFYGIYSSEEFASYIGKLKMRMNPRRMILCIMEISHLELVQEKFNDEKKQLIKYSIKNTLDELMDKFKRGESFFENDTHYILIFNFDDIYSEKDLHQELNKILTDIRDILSTFFNALVSFGVSSLRDGYALLPKMYEEASSLIKRKFLFGEGIFYPVQLNGLEEKINNIIENLSSFEKLTKFFTEETVNQYRHNLNMLRNVIPKGREATCKFFSGLNLWTLSSLHLRNSNFNELTLLYNEKINESETLNDIVELYKRFIGKVTQSVLKNKTLNQQISEAINYINNNYEKSISLQQVADYVNLNPVYLSNLFKRELKVNFVDYLNELRVEKAKDLLLDTYLKTYEIAEKVGFAENTYFSKVFKKITGESPNEFRKRYMQEWTEVLDSEDN